MKSLIATAALTFVFLSAGVVHGVGQNAASARPATSHNVTVIYKNQTWPVFEETALASDSCKTARCVDA